MVLHILENPGHIETSTICVAARIFYALLQLTGLGFACPPLTTTHARDAGDGAPHTVEAQPSIDDLLASAARKDAIIERGSTNFPLNG